MAISSMGIGSGIDVQSLVQQLLAAERAPWQNRLDRSEAKLQGELSALGAVKGALSKFQSALASLKDPANFSKRTATSSDTDQFAVSASSSAVAASYQVQVIKLAQAHKLASTGFTSSTDVVGTSGSLTFQFGDPTKPAQTVAIASGDNTLEGIRDAVNEAKIGVTATIVNGDAGYQLVFSSDATGIDNALNISAIDDTGTGLTDFVAGLTQKQAAQDAILDIDGITVTRATNNISDAIDGVTLDLKTEGTSAGTLSVALDKGSVSTAVDSFVSAFNSLTETMNMLTKYDPETRKGGPLVGDPTVRGINTELRRIIGSAVEGLSGAYQSLADIGLKTSRTGTLSLDSTKLQEALNNNFDDISKLFSAGLNPTNAFVSYVGSEDTTKVGEYDIFISQVATQSSYLGTALDFTTPLAVTSANDNFTIMVDGVQSAALSLSQKDYATAEELAAEMQSRINGDSNLQDAGVTVTVSVDAGGEIRITSDSYGSDSSVEIIAPDAGIGLTAGSGTTAVDVEGTIGGVAATGSGQYLTGTGDAEGLKIKYVGTALDDMGSVTFSRGVADQLGTVLTRLLDTEGTLASRTGSLSERVKDIGIQREALDRRIASIEKRYVKQFTAMDALIAQMNSMGQYLTQQLANLPKMGA